MCLMSLGSSQPYILSHSQKPPTLPNRSFTQQLTHGSPSQIRRRSCRIPSNSPAARKRTVKTRAWSHSPPILPLSSGTHETADGGIYRDRDPSNSSLPPPQQDRPGIDRFDSHRSTNSQQSNFGQRLVSPSEEKENGGLSVNDGRGKPGLSRGNSGSANGVGGGEGEGGQKPVENWKRAAEVTSQLKARIEQMKVCCFLFSWKRLRYRVGCFIRHDG